MKTTLILSSAPIHGRFLPSFLARKLEKHGIPILLSRYPWPRDELFIHPSGAITHVQKNVDSELHQPHFAWNGGTFLRGDNFIIGSLTANPVDKQEATHNILGVERGHYFDISDQLDALSYIDPSFFTSSFPHIDILYDIDNAQRTLFTYDHPSLCALGEQMSSVTGYNLVTLPLCDAPVAAVGFVALEGKIILDRRAKHTRKTLAKRGYEIIITPFGLQKTNENYGSLRCITAESPIPLKQLFFEPVDPFEQRIVPPYRRLFTREGEEVVTSQFGNQLCLRY